MTARTFLRTLRTTNSTPGIEVQLPQRFERERSDGKYEGDFEIRFCRSPFHLVCRRYVRRVSVQDAQKSFLFSDTGFGVCECTSVVMARGRVDFLLDPTGSGHRVNFGETGVENGHDRSVVVDLFDLQDLLYATM